MTEDTHNDDHTRTHHIEQQKDDNTIVNRAKRNNEDKNSLNTTHKRTNNIFVTKAKMQQEVITKRNKGRVSLTSPL